MNLTTKYLGLDLCSPLIVGANPLTENIDELRKMEDAQAGAIVLLSLFEEQLTLSKAQLNDLIGEGVGGHARAMASTPERGRVQLGPLGYLELIRKAKEAVKTPIIASLNGSPRRQWTQYAKLVEQAGADGIELNLYYVPTAPKLGPESLEQSYFDAVKSVRDQVQIPVAVKLTPFFSNLTWSVGRFAEAGAQGLVLFNRFYQPDVDLEAGTVRPRINLSTSQELLLPLRWIGILREQTQASLSATTGVHTAHDALKLIAVGADTVQLCSVLLKHGVEQLDVIRRGMVAWMEAHDTQLADLRGSMAPHRGPNAATFERAQYMRNLDSFSGHNA